MIFFIQELYGMPELSYDTFYFILLGGYVIIFSTYVVTFVGLHSTINCTFRDGQHRGNFFDHETLVYVVLKN